MPAMRDVILRGSTLSRSSTECLPLPSLIAVLNAFCWDATDLERSHSIIAIMLVGLVFASELSALALHPVVTGGPSIRALQKYFAYGYVPAPLAVL